MSRKKTYSEIKEYIELFDYKLLSTEYINSDKKLKLQCPKGHTFSMSWGHFKQGTRCIKCFHDSLRLTIEDLKQQVPSLAPGYKLLSTEYKNCDTKLRVQCDKNHIYKTTWDYFKQGNRCPVCSGTQKLTHKFVKESIEATGYKLLSKTYINSKTKLKVLCPEGHIYKVHWNNFKTGKRCPECQGTKKLTYEFIKNKTQEIAEGYELLSSKYINNSTKLIFKCDKGHIFKMCWGNFKQGQRCSKCRGTKKLSIRYIKEEIAITAPNYKLLSTKYINCSTKLKFKCDKNHVFKMNWNNFRAGKRCSKCFHDSIRKTYTLTELTKMYWYKKAVEQYTKQNYKKYYTIINPNNLRRGRNKYHLDHIFSVMMGFKLDIKPEIIANPYNLQMLVERENIIKSDMSWQTKQELYLGYYKFKLEETKEENNICQN